MAKQIQTNDTDFPALAAFEKIRGKLIDTTSSRERHAREIREIQKPNIAGVAEVIAEKPSDEGDDIEAEAFVMLNGSSIQAAPSRKGGEAARLYDLERLLRIEDRVIQLAGSQTMVAAAAASKEAIDRNREEILATHRRRALCVLELLALNDRVEDLRARVSIGGVTPDFPIDGFTGRLFGRASEPNSPVGHWARQYLQACVAAGLITQKELGS